MVETFTPAVCGSRRRTWVAAAFFAVSAVIVAAALGALLGLAGGALGAGRAVLAAAALALVAAAREAGLVRFPLPQARRQVPEGWRFRLPLPVWSTGYGAGLGAGVFTYQPVSTFWVACAGALALGRPLAAALCFSLFGAGRALMVVLPLRRGGDATEAVEGLVRRKGAVLRLNAATLAGCAVLLALAPAAGGAVVADGLDPTVSGGAVAWATQDGSVVVRDGGDEEFTEASAPALDGDRLAYVAADGIRIVNRRTRDPIGHLRVNATAVALDWPWIAYRVERPKRRVLILRNLDTGAARTIARLAPSADLGRPSLRHGRLAWHAANKRGSKITLYKVKPATRKTVDKSKIALLRNPSVFWQRVLWVDERAALVRLRYQGKPRARPRTLKKLKSRDLSFWTTDLSRQAAYATRWSLRSGSATIYSFGY